MATRNLIITAAVLCASVVEGSAAPILVIESHVGGRPEQAAHRLDRLLEELDQLGYAARPATIMKVVGGRMPRSGILDKGLLAEDILKEVESGYEDVTKALWANAEKKLERAIRRIERNPALFVHDTGYLPTIEKAYIGLTLSQLREGNRDRATATMNKLIRIARAQPISRFEHGKTAEGFARETYEQVSTIGRGRLTITVDNPRAMIFVDRQLRGIGKAAIADLIPGMYSVLIQEPQRDSLQFTSDIRANEDSVLDVRWPLDSKLIVTDSWIGIDNATEEQRKDQGVMATSYAQRWMKQDLVTVVGTKRINGKLAVFGTVYRANGKVVREGAVMLDEADDKQLRLLARFIFDGTPNVGIAVSGAPAEDSPRAPTSSRRGLILGGLGLAAVAVGTILVKTNEADPNGPQQETLLSKPGLGLQIGGELALAVGGYLWIRDSKAPARRAIPFVVTTLGLLALETGAILLATDEDAVDSKGPNFNDTARDGVILGSVGAVAVLVGGVLWWTSTKSSVAPTVSISRGHAFAGFSTSF